MSKNKDLKYRAVCPYCKKGFDTRSEGFKDQTGQLICADCFGKLTYKVYNPRYYAKIYPDDKVKEINW